MADPHPQDQASMAVVKIISELEQPPATLEIKADGDLLLLIGSDKLPLLVSSHIFRTASKVFDAMLSPTFQEGTGFAKCDRNAPYELSLPEDDPEALTLLARLLHFQGPVLDDEQKKDIQGLIKFIILCDKYDCGKAVALYIGVWQKSCDASNPSQLVVAYLMDDAALFMSVSQYIILNHALFSISSRKTADPDALLPIKLWTKISIKQRDAWTVINTMVTEFPMTGVNGLNPFGLNSFHLYENTGKEIHIQKRHPHANCGNCILTGPLKALAFLTCLAESHLWPLVQNLSVHALIAALLQAVDEDKIEAKWVSHKGVNNFNERACRCKKKSWAQYCNEIEAAVKVKIGEGICKDCLPGDKRRACRIAHT